MSPNAATKQAVRAVVSEAAPRIGIALPIYKPRPERQKIKALFYGMPGVGKTTLLASAQACLGPGLMFNVEGGILSIASPEVYGAKEVPDTIDFDNFKDVVDVFDYLRKGTHEYTWFGIDSLSELAKYNLDYVVDTKKNRKDDQDEDDVYLEDYGTMTKKMRRVLRLFRNLPYHVFMTCHDGPVSKVGSKLGPALTPSLRTSAVGFVDICGYMFTKEEKAEGQEGENLSETMVLNRYLLTSPHPNYIAKDRSPGEKLRGVIKNPTMTEIFRRLNS